MVLRVSRSFSGGGPSLWGIKLVPSKSGASKLRCPSIALDHMEIATGHCAAESFPGFLQGSLGSKPFWRLTLTSLFGG